jgi:hypothetical protein
VKILILTKFLLPGWWLTWPNLLLSYKSKISVS